MAKAGYKVWEEEGYKIKADVEPRKELSDKSTMKLMRNLPLPYPFYLQRLILPGV